MNQRLKFCLLLLMLFCALAGNASAAWKVLYTRLENGHWQVWAAEADGANPHQVTASNWDKRCLRSAGTNDSLLLRDNEGKLHQISLVGTQDEKLLPLDFEVIKDFDFNPQSGFLIASYAPNALDNVCVWHLAEISGPKRLLIPDPYLNETPRWVAGCQQFIFAKSHAGHSKLYISELGHPKATPFLKAGPPSCSDPCPSPDGKQVVFCGQGRSLIDLWICSITGTDVRELYHGPGIEGEPTWSPDGVWIYFTTWDGSNFRVARIRPAGNYFGFVSEQSFDSRCPVIITQNGETHE